MRSYGNSIARRAPIAPSVGRFLPLEARSRMSVRTRQRATNDRLQNRHDDLSFECEVWLALVPIGPGESMGTGEVVEMQNSNYFFLIILAFLAPHSGGCSDRVEETVARLVVTPVSDSPPIEPAASPTPAPAVPESSPPATEEDRGGVTFEYPFPDREDLFLPPTTKSLTHESRVKRDGDVVLMGFADVGGVRTVLKIDGIVTSLRVGETRGDIRVLAIEPPEVNLQHGERQWTESLAEKR